MRSSSSTSLLKSSCPLNEGPNQGICTESYPTALHHLSLLSSSPSFRQALKSYQFVDDMQKQELLGWDSRLVTAIIVFSSGGLSDRFICLYFLTQFRNEVQRGRPYRD